MTSRLERYHAGDHWFSKFARLVLGPAVAALFRTRFFGVENVPDGPAILCGNHVSYLDPILIGTSAPRPPHFMAKRQLWDKPWLRWFLDRLYAFPVNREGADRAALETGVRHLREGRLVGVFPEGTRVLDPSEAGEAHGGAAFLALHTHVPIVPVGIAGTDKVWPKGRRLPRLPHVTVVYGEPVSPEGYTEGGRKERVAAMTAEVMRRIAEELETARRLDAGR